VNAVGYVRVSRQEQAKSGLGLEAQRRAIRTACKQRGWTLVRIEEDVRSGRSDRNREGLRAALASCKSGEVEALIVSKLDRLSRSVVDAGTIIKRAQREKWNLVALDMGLDMSTSNGRLFAHILLAVAEWERERIAERISEGLAVKRERDGWRPQGRPRQIAPTTRALIVSLAGAGRSAGQIAAELNRRGVEALGARWPRTTVDRVLLQERG
jgi:DNA invertase Pin-like site-specific DNA recombinase